MKILGYLLAFVLSAAGLLALRFFFDGVPQHPEAWKSVAVAVVCLWLGLALIFGEGWFFRRGSHTK